MGTPVLYDEAGEADLVIRERRRWSRTFYVRVPGSTSISDPPYEFPSGTVGYLVFRANKDDAVLLELGPGDASLDGTLEVDVESGDILLDVFVPAGLDFPGGLGVWELVIWPAGELGDAYTLLEGSVRYEYDLVQRTS